MGTKIGGKLDRLHTRPLSIEGHHRRPYTAFSKLVSTFVQKFRKLHMNCCRTRVSSDRPRTRCGYVAENYSPTFGGVHTHRNLFFCSEIQVFVQFSEFPWSGRVHTYAPPHEVAGCPELVPVTLLNSDCVLKETAGRLEL